MTEARQKTLCERLKKLGFGRNRRIELYGEKYDLTSDPIVVDDRLAVVDAIERRSGQSRRIRIPLPVLQMASQTVDD